MKVGVIGLMMMATAMVLTRPTQCVTCGDVDGCVRPCAGFLSSGTGNPPTDCCNGVRRLQSITPYPADRRAACQCLKDIAARAKSIKPEAARSLPGRCGVRSPVPISKDVDCSRINDIPLV